MDLELRDKVAVVTGAGSGIGAAIARLLHAESVRVALVDIDPAKATGQARAIDPGGDATRAIRCDVTDEASVTAMMNETIEAFGGLDILVNNAGFTRDMRIVRMGVSDWDAVVDVILKGAYLCTRAAVPHLERRGAGRIINMSSRAHLGNPGQANYSAGKAGLIGFTRAMALELGRHRITVNAVAPGIIDTDAVRALPHYAKIVEAATKTTPIPRIGQVDDVASTVVFLASGPAGYITGDTVHVTGGRY